MYFNLLMLLTIIPAIFVLWVGLWLIPWAGGVRQTRHWILWLLCAAILILIPAAIFADTLRTTEIGLVMLVFLPALEGILALLIVQWRAVHSLWQVDRVIVSILLLILGLLVVLTARTSPFFPLIIILLPVLLAGVWALGGRLGLSGLLVVSLIVFTWQVSEAVGLLGHRLYGAPEWVSIVSEAASTLSIFLTLTLAGIMVYRAVDGKRTLTRTNRYLYLGMAVILLLGVLVAVMRHGVMIEATAHGAEDHLPFGQVALAVSVGMMLVALSEGQSRWAGVAFMVLVPSLVGFFYLAGSWFKPHRITEARADRLASAIEQYYQENDEYPTRLNELTPGYMPLILGPLTGRAQVWCYQGGQDTYRLGYVFIQRYYEASIPFPHVEVKIHASAGDEFSTNWMCDGELQRAEDTLGL